MIKRPLLCFYYHVNSVSAGWCLSLPLQCEVMFAERLRGRLSLSHGLTEECCYRDSITWQPTQQEGRRVNDYKQRKIKPVKKKKPDLTQRSRGLSLKAQFVFRVHATAASCHFPSASGREAGLHLAVYSQEQAQLMLLL